ncbi:MAG: hypothetical protein WA990_16755 [Rubrobacteraceae bacterium]
MSDQMSRLGRMVDEALSEADAPPEAANTTVGFPKTDPAGRYARRAIGGGTSHQAIEDICWIYQDRSLAENLRRYGWRQARRNVMRQGPLSKEWMSHRGRPPVRLTRKGVEVKLADGIETLSWQRIQSQVGSRRS